MSNEPIQCPTCGSGDVRQLAPESYDCEHCHTNFRWVDPTKKTVVHKPSVCTCGSVATAFCVRCHEPLCNSHRATERTDIYSHHRERILNLAERARVALGEQGYCAGIRDGRSDEFTKDFICARVAGTQECQPKWILELLKTRGISFADECAQSSGSILCGRCHNEQLAADLKAWDERLNVWDEIVEEVFSSYRQQIAKGQACAGCLSDEVDPCCPVCGRAFCSRCSRLGYEQNRRRCVGCVFNERYGLQTSRGKISGEKTLRASSWLGKLWK